VGDRTVALRRDEPRNWWRTSALVVLVAGLIAAGAWVAYAMNDQGRHVESFVNLPPQSDLPVEVPAPGVYTIWASAIAGGWVETPPVEEMHEMLVLGFDGPVDSDDPVRVEPEPYYAATRYRVDGSRFGVATWTVEFPEAGTYIVERRNLGTGGVVLSLGEGIGMPSRITSGLLGVAVVTTLLVVGLLAAGWWRERREINAMTTSFDSFHRKKPTDSASL
jgi:hypothetical protein